jgi:diacylglycerol kinase
MPRPSFLKSRYNSFRFAFKGINIAMIAERNMHLHMLAAILVVLTGIILQITRIEWCLLIGSIGLVIMAEIFNTAIETLTDLVSPEHNVLAGKTKDLAAGAVLIAAITAAAIGLFVFIPYFFSL